MDSIATKQLKAGFRRQLFVSGETLVDANGNCFIALLQNYQPTEMELDSVRGDIRETATIESLREQTPKLENQSTLTQRSNSQRWRVTHRSDNPSDFVVVHTLVKISAEKDTR